MNNGTAWMIGASALGVVFVCSGLGGVGFYLASQRVVAEQARMQDDARRAQAEAQEQVLAAQGAQAQALAQAEAQVQAAHARALAQGAGEPTQQERPEAARQAILRSRGQVRRCYEQLLRENASASVRTTVELVFAADGSASSVTSRIDEATPADLETTVFSSCVEATFRAVAIPPGTDALTLSVPLVFAS